MLGGLDIALDGRPIVVAARRQRALLALLLIEAGNVDGLPNVLLEAMAAGRAVVASRVAGIPDVIVDGVNGLLVPPGDVSALRTALERLLADEPLRRRLGAAARAHAREHLSWESATDRLLEAYAAATGAPAGRPPPHPPR